jgi:putative YhbY family RNA-binding protein
MTDQDNNEHINGPLEAPPASAPLTVAERMELRARAHHLHPSVIVGDAGLTDAVLAEVGRALAANELIKVRVMGDDRAARAAALQTLCAQLGAQPVQTIGKILVIHRRAEAPAKADIGAGKRGSSGKRPDKGSGKRLGARTPSESTARSGRGGKIGRDTYSGPYGGGSYGGDRAGGTRAGSGKAARRGTVWSPDVQERVARMQSETPAADPRPPRPGRAPKLGTKSRRPMRRGASEGAGGTGGRRSGPRGGAGSRGGFGRAARPATPGAAPRKAGRGRGR